MLAPEKPTASAPRRNFATPYGGVRSKYKGARAQILPHQGQTWWRRILPVIASHRLTFIVAIVFSFLSLVLQTLVPNMMRNAIDSSLNPIKILALKGHSLAPLKSELHHQVLIIILVGVLTGITGLISRQYLFYLSLIHI